MLRAKQKFRWAYIWPELSLQTGLTQGNPCSMEHELDVAFCSHVRTGHARGRVDHGYPDFLAYSDELSSPIGLVAVDLLNLRRRIPS